MSSSHPFSGSAAAALALYEDWVKAAKVRSHAGHSLLKLQTVCCEAGCSLPELDSYERASSHRRPGFLLLGGNMALASELATLFGYTPRFGEHPDIATVWSIDCGKPSIRVRRGDHLQITSRKDLPEVLAALPPTEEITFIEERAEVAAEWRFLWLPYPERFHVPDYTPSEIEALLSQRATVAFETTPDPIRKLLLEMGQKVWLMSTNQITIEEERKRFRAEVSTLLGDGPEELDIRAGASWFWLSARLLEQIEDRKRHNQQIVTQYESKVSSTRHLLGQYRKNWTGGVRSLTEAYLQNRTASPAFASLLDASKPGPEVASYMAALGLQALWTKLDEYVVDRMADFVAGLTGHAAKMELRQIRLGDIKARWSVRPLSSKLEAYLNDKRVFPSGGGKRGGLVGNLTGRKQAVMDERKAQLLKASRLTLQFIETEFSEWASNLTSKVEDGIALQLTAALANQGFSDAESLRTATGGLERLEELIQGKHDSGHDARSAAVEWLRLIASRRWIPLYEAR